MVNIKNKFQIKEILEYHHYYHNDGYVFQGHRHFESEINIIVSGELEIASSAGVYCVKKNEMVLIPPSTFHRNRVIGNSPCELIVIHFTEDNRIPRNKFVVFRTDNDTAALVKMFIRDMEQNAVIKSGACVSYNETSQKLLELIIQYSSGNDLIKREEKSELPTVHNRAIKYMLDHFPENITVEDIARECGVSMTTLKSHFSRYIGKGIISFYNELKLEQAKRLLLSGKTCSEVTEELMFSSQGYFTRCFKNFYGVTPMKFKNSKS